MPFYMSKVDRDDAIIGCECGYEGLRVSWDDDFDELILCQCFGGVLPWRERVAVAWRILTKGNHWPDQIMLDGADARNLGEWIMQKAKIIESDKIGPADKKG